jgi:hypothetical protein
MVWLIVGGIGVLIVVAAAYVWTVIALLSEVGEEQDSAADESEFDSADQPRRRRNRVWRF